MASITPVTSRTIRGSGGPAGGGITSSAGARKSGVPHSESRTARKTSNKVVGDGDGYGEQGDDDEEQERDHKSESENTTSPIRKSSSGTTPSVTGHPVSTTTRTHPPASSTSTDESSLPPLGQSKRGGKDNIILPPGVNPPGLAGGGGGKGRGKTAPGVLPPLPSSSKGAGTSTGAGAGVKRKATTATTTTTSESVDTETEDQTSSIDVRSRSPRGYTWEVELLTIKPEDVRHRISYHNSITTSIEREGKNEKVRFRRGDKLWILPDPQWLPPVSHEVEINELADDEWWVGEILDCCALDQASQRQDSLGLLRVAWYYSPDHCYKLDNLHDDWKKKVRRYRFDEAERIKSDHVDFIGIECFAGFADGVYTYLNVLGLEVDDEERMKAAHRRAKSRRIVRMTGFTLKEDAKRLAEREARLERNPAMARKIRSSDRARRGQGSQPQYTQEDYDDEDDGQI